MGSVLEGLGLLRGGGEGSPVLVLVLVLVLDGGVSPSSLLSQVQAARGATGTGGRRHRLGEEISEGLSFIRVLTLFFFNLTTRIAMAMRKNARKTRKKPRTTKYLCLQTSFCPVISSMMTLSLLSDTFLSFSSSRISSVLPSSLMSSSNSTGLGTAAEGSESSVVACMERIYIKLKPKFYFIS